VLEQKHSTEKITSRKPTTVMLPRDDDNWLASPEIR